MARSSTSFKRGQSGNPGGRPKEVTEVRSLARRHTTEAVEALRSIMKDSSEPASARVAAANSLLDRAWGRPPQTIIGEDGGNPAGASAEISPAVLELIAQTTAGIPGGKLINGEVVKNDAKQTTPALSSSTGG
jgi:hypothetical protein